MKGSFFQTPQMPCNVRGSISTMQVEVVGCWKYCKYHANCLFGLDGFASFLSSWLCKKLYRLLDFMALFVNLFTRTKATSARKSQTRPTPKPRPQQQQFLACSSSYTTPQQQPQEQQQQQNQQQQETTITTYNYGCSYNTKTTATIQQLQLQQE